MGKLKPINPTKAQIVANPQAAAHDYDNLTHKPQINGHELVGNKSSDDLGLQGKLTAGENITINANGEISATGGTITSAAVNQNGTITFTMSDGSTVTTTGKSVIGPQGPAGADGNDYVLTNQDKSDIADLVLAQLPTTQGVQYGNTSN